jgi:hypothetical protein
LGLGLFAFMAMSVIASLSLAAGILTVAAAALASAMYAAASFIVADRTFQRFRDGDEGAGTSRSGGLWMVGRKAVLALAVYAVAFGPATALAGVAGVYAWLKYSNAVEETRTAIADEKNRVDSMLYRSKLFRKRIQADAAAAKTSQDSDIGLFADNEQIERFVSSFLRLSVYFMTPIFVLFLAGIIFLPAAFASALESGSVKRVIHPVNLMREMRRFGFEHVKLTVIAYVFIALTFGACLAAVVYMPSAIPEEASMPIAFAVEGLFAYIFWSAFSYLLSLTMYRTRVEKSEE